MADHPFQRLRPELVIEEPGETLGPPRPMKESHAAETATSGDAFPGARG